MPQLKKIATHIEQLNKTNKFIAGFAKRNGYAVWDKTLLHTVKSSQQHYFGHGHQSTASNADSIYYIPLVLDSTNYVNGYLKAIIADTITLSYELASDYVNLLEQPNNILSAEQYATRYFKLNKLVFGHVQFNITDKRLFYSTGADTAHMMITATLKDSTADNNFVPQICQTVEVSTICTICYVFYCPNRGWTLIQVCEPLDGGSSGGGGALPPPSGGGSGGGGSTIPPRPGWVPIIPEMPCNEFINGLQNNTTFKSKFKFLNKDSVTSLNHEYGFALRLSDSVYMPKAGNPNEMNIKWNDILLGGTKIDGLLHSHYEVGYTKLSSVFSPEDVMLMAELYVKSKVADTTNFFFGITSSYGKPLLLKVSNPAKFRVFAEKHIGSNGNDYKKAEKFIKNYLRDYKSADENDPYENELAFLKMLKKEKVDDGLSLYRGNDDCSVWTKLNLSSGSISPIPCNIQ